ncbi:MAG: AMP-binding protein, partial [Pseudomonadota bacterium]
MAGLLTHAVRTPDKPALIFGDNGFIETYGELELRSRRIALALTAAGVKPGDCIAILMSNHPAFFDVYWATQRLGAYLTPLNWHSDLDELGYVISNSDARVLIVEAKLTEKAQRLRESADPDLTLFFSVGGALPDYDRLDRIAEGIPGKDATLDER